MLSKVDFTVECMAENRITQQILAKLFQIELRKFDQRLRR
jgi:hypothetical protein